MSAMNDLSESLDSSILLASKYIKAVVKSQLGQVNNFKGIEKYRKFDNRRTKENKVEPLLRGQPDERPPPLERPLDNVNLNMNVLISTPDERPPILKGHFSAEKGWPHKRGSTVYIKHQLRI